MNPAFLDNMSYEMAEVYGAISDQIMINLAKYFPFIDNGKIPRSSFQYQAAMLAQMGQVNRETIKIIASGLKGADEALQGVLQQAIIDAVKKVEPELVKAVRRGLLQPTGIPVVAPNQMRAFQLYYQQAAEKLNLVNTVMLESTRSAYTQAVAGVVSELQIAERIAATQTALDIGAGELVTGAASFNQAMRHATDRLKQHGITGFIDHAGRQWSAEAYVAMDMRTTVFNTGRAAVWETNQDFGNDLYIVSYHSGARPLCYPFQNKVISSTNRFGVTYDLDGNEVPFIAQSDTTYGEAAGLFGINCQHYPDPFIPGVSVIHGEPQSKEENDRVYAESQEQRRLERKVREEKRDLEMLKAQGASKEEIAAQREKVREASTRVQDFCDETGRARHKDREAVYTSREFPEKERYDVAAFERSQKEIIDQYFTGGGAQQGYTFGQMTPNEPIVPATPPTAPQNVALQVTQNPYGIGMFSNATGMDDTFKEGMARTLLDSGNDRAIRLFGKYADELKVYDPEGRKGTFFKRSEGGVSMKLSYVAKGSSYEKPYEVAYHEFGHMLDWLIGGKKWSFASSQPIEGQMLRDVIKADYKVFKKSIGAKNVREVISILKSENMSEYARGNISDILEFCTGISYPLGLGHGAGYHKNPGSTETEFFAEVLDSAISNPESYAQMTRLFPNAVNLVWKLIEGVL